MLKYLERSGDIPRIILNFRVGENWYSHWGMSVQFTGVLSLKNTLYYTWPYILILKKSFCALPLLPCLIEISFSSVPLYHCRPLPSSSSLASSPWTLPPLLKCYKGELVTIDICPSLSILHFFGMYLSSLL